MDNPPSDKSIRDMVDENFRGLIPKNLTFEEFYWIVDKNILPPGFDLTLAIEHKEKSLKKVEEVKVPEISPQIAEKPKEKVEVPVVEEIKTLEIVKESEKTLKTSQPEIKEPEYKAKQKDLEPVADEWVTVKNRSKKKPDPEPVQIPGIKSDPPVDQQASLKNKKKALKKRLKEVKDLIKKQSEGQKLNPHQLQKIQNKEALEKEILSLA